MILRRRGQRLQSVRPLFDALAMTEIAFERTDDALLEVAEFERDYARQRGLELSAAAAGDVQAEIKDEVLRALRQRLDALHDSLGEDAVLVIENQPGRDPARTQVRQTTRVVGDENRYHFAYTIDPPLKVGVYQRRSAQ